MMLATVQPAGQLDLAPFSLMELILARDELPSFLNPIPKGLILICSHCLRLADMSESIVTLGPQALSLLCQSIDWPSFDDQEA